MFATEQPLRYSPEEPARSRTLSVCTRPPRDQTRSTSYVVQAALPPAVRRVHEPATSFTCVMASSASLTTIWSCDKNERDIFQGHPERASSRWRRFMLGVGCLRGQRASIERLANAPFPNWTVAPRVLHQEASAIANHPEVHDGIVVLSDETQEVLFFSRNSPRTERDYHVLGIMCVLDSPPQSVHLQIFPIGAIRSKHPEVGP
ncbi:hypothetical protein HG530_014180 [Fusarium avenaceum]|nr:hypothetical protein HG530_014180 [Fusarium avenaceum]